MMRTSARENLQYLAYKATVTFKAGLTKSAKSANRYQEQFFKSYKS